MKWIKITAVLAFFLIVVNVFLFYNLTKQYSNTSLIDSESINNTVLLLGKADIYISENLIPRKKPDYKIFEGAFYTNLEEYYINTAMLFSGSQAADDFTLHMINDGIKIKENNGDEVFEFYNDNIFSFKFLYDSQLAIDRYTDIKNENDKIYDADLEYKKINTYREIEKLINIKFFGEYRSSFKNSSKESYMQIEVKKIYYNKDENIYTAECIQTLNGLEIYSCEALCIIYDGTMIYAEGNIIFSSTGNSYYTELYDPISVLFDEKAYIEQQRRGLVTEESSGGDIIRKITGLKSIYCISWNADRSKFYLIPSWYIEYNSNIIRIRNAVNGNIYTI